MSPNTYSAAQLELGKRLGSATLHEAAGRSGALPSGIKPVATGMKLCGPAFTVHCPPFSNLQIHQALYHAQPGDVLVVHVGGGAQAGYWGGILNAAAIERRLGGLVIDGGVRDTEELSGAPFPVFSNGVCIRGTGKDHNAIAFIQQPVQIGNVIIMPGDLVAGDADGVVVIAKNTVAETLAAAVAREADEAEKIRKILAGARTIDLYGFGAGKF